MYVCFPVSPANVEAAILLASLQSLHLYIDSLPVTVLKGVADLLSPFLAHFVQSVFPSEILPLLLQGGISVMPYPKNLVCCFLIPPPIAQSLTFLSSLRY
jgi:hypothetical protein